MGLMGLMGLMGPMGHMGLMSQYDSISRDPYDPYDAQERFHPSSFSLQAICDRMRNMKYYLTRETSI